ncbi:unnamed protein product [Nezara viridula]|uniref:Methyltransferase type 12 domain-containing protein n=1 Tax=Nezara viridula TaxID=85310 RepID=A0A9P0E1P4_NEZVI|nr:unnamed protein product [Nezara viridula]
MAQRVEVPSNPAYIEKADIIEALEKHIRKFDWRGEECVVLDADCGLGEVTKDILLPLLPQHATLIGWDSSGEKIEYCKKVRKDERLSFHEIDVQFVDLFFNWRFDYFHKIFSFYCIHWMQNYRRSLGNMYSLLKNNGDILLIFLTPDNPMYRAFERVKQFPLYERLFSNFSWFYKAPEPVGFIRRLLDEIGFSHVYCWMKMSSTVYPSFDVYMDVIDKVNPYLDGLHPNQIGECRRTIWHCIRHDPQITEDESTGEITVNYSLVIAVAKKVIKEETKEK